LQLTSRISLKFNFSSSSLL